MRKLLILLFVLLIAYPCYAAEEIKIVDPDSGAGFDYSSLSAWEAAEQDDLTSITTQKTAKCRSTSGGDDTTGVIVIGWDTDATNYIKIWTDTGESYRHDGKWNDSKYILTSAVTGGANATLEIAENFVRVDGLQIDNTAGGTDDNNGMYYTAQTGTPYISISNTIVRRSGASTGNSRGIRLNDGNIVADLWNCIVYDYLTSGLHLDNGTTFDVYNCTVYNCGVDGVNQDAGTVTATSVASWNNTDDFDGTITIANCASDDGDGSNPVTPADWDDVFEDITNRDFHLKSTDTDLIGAGVDDPGSGLFSDDIDGETRVSTWDIGADEFIAAAAPTFIPTIQIF